MAARRCIANQDYTAQGDDELTFKKGDKIYVVSPNTDDNDRVKGVFNGKVGFFPDSCIKDTSAKFQAGKASRARAVMDYKAKNDGELSFPKGAIIFIAAKLDTNYKGIYKGKVGLFPTVMVEDASNTQTLARKKKKLDEKASATWTPPEGYKGLRCKAILTYPGNEAKGELPFGIGDIIEVPEGGNKGKKWKGETMDKSGTFPATHVLDTATVPDSDITAKINENKATADEKANAEAYEKILNGDAAGLGEGADAAIEQADEGGVKAQEITDKKARKEAEKAAKKAAKGK